MISPCGIYVRRALTAGKSISPFCKSWRPRFLLGGVPEGEAGPTSNRVSCCSYGVLRVGDGDACGITIAVHQTW